MEMSPSMKWTIRSVLLPHQPEKHRSNTPSSWSTQWGLAYNSPILLLVMNSNKNVFHLKRPSSEKYILRTFQYGWLNYIYPLHAKCYFQIFIYPLCSSWIFFLSAFMNSWITAHNNLLLALIPELHLMLHLRDISSIKCNISDSFSIGRTRSPLYSRIVVLFKWDRTQLSNSVFAEQSIRIDLPDYFILTNDSFFSNFITSRNKTT